MCNARIAGRPRQSQRQLDNQPRKPLFECAHVSTVATRRQAVISRGLNLMARLGRAEEAAGLFEKELAAAPEGPGSDALLLGLVNARLTQGKRKEAEAAVKQMEARFAGSPYTARAKQNLAAAGK